MLTIYWEQGFLFIGELGQQSKMVEFISDRVSCITLKGQWCDIIVINVHIPSEDKGNELKIAYIFDQLPINNMKILLGDFNEKSDERTFSSQQYGT